MTFRVHRDITLRDSGELGGPALPRGGPWWALMTDRPVTTLCRLQNLFN